MTSPPAAPTTSRIPDLIDKLVAAFGTVITGTSGAFGPRLVVDGPKPESEDARDVVFVGYQGQPSDLTSVDFSQGWAGLGAKKKNETIEVRCGCVCVTGDDDIAGLRRGVFATFVLVEQALRGDPGLGFPGPAVATITGGQLVQESGRRVRLPFTVNFAGRI